jgi:oxygen-dependent protoporphyrinogen oxidase
MTARVLADLHEAAGIDAVPQEVHITRFPRALPQYRVGHLDRVAQIAAASDAPEGLHLAGAAYRGVGVAACIKDGALAAERIAGRHGTPAAAPTP